MLIKGNTYKNNYKLSEKEILRKINQSKIVIRDIKVGIASFTPEESGQDEYTAKLNQERSNYTNLLKELAIAKARSKNSELNKNAKQSLEKMKLENQEDSHKKLKNNKFRYVVFSLYDIKNEQIKSDKKQIIDNIIY
jgi:hypothetical protein